MNHRIPRSIVVLSAVLVAMLAVSPVAANTRTQRTIVVDGTDPDAGFCSYPVSLTESGTFAIADYFDKSGVLYKSIVTSYQGQLTLTLFNPANGKSVTTQNESQVIIVEWLPDGSPASITRTGVTFAFTYPGLGTVLLNVGRLEVDRTTGSVFVAGPHELLKGDFDELCAALA
jgi:hypothetical protein